MAMLALASHPYSIALRNQPTPRAPSHSVAEAFSSREFPGACGNDAPIDLSPSPPPSFPPSLPDLLRLPDMVACMSFGMAPLATAAPRPRTPLVGTSTDGQAMGMKLDRRSRGLCRITRPAEKRPIVRMSIAANSGRELPEDTETERWKASTVAAVVLGGGAGTRLFPLTMRRAKPAVPIGGAYRLIDVPISNCINSGIRKVFILTQFNSASLNRHIAQSYNFNSCTDFGDGFFEVLAATQTPGDKGKRWFQGTADAVRQFLWLFDDAKCKDIHDVIILSGDHLYRMDYMDFVQTHRDTGADITISCVPMDESRASDSSLMKMDGSRRIISFSEEPKGENLKAMAFDTSILGLSVQEAAKYPYIASMGVYVFKKNLLLDLLRCHYPTANDFASEVIPGASKDFLVRAYLFNDYWEDIGTIKSFFEANLALTAHPSRFFFYDATNPMYTSRRNLPPSTVDNCKVIDSIISHGSFLSNCVIEHSVIGIRSRVTSNVHLKDTVMLGADFYETDDEIKATLAEGKLPVGIGENTNIRNCIIDKNARIGKNVTISNSDGVEEGDRPDEGFYIRSGITIVTKNATICDGFTIKFFVISTKDGIPENAVRKSPAGGDSEAGDASNFDSALTIVT